jgi:hypothetical protein
MGVYLKTVAFWSKTAPPWNWAAATATLFKKRKCISIKTLWPSGLRRWLKAPVRKGEGSNPTGVNFVHVQ